ncbi:hypothetical protein L7F22_046414 [Adiantum nelumboides]|nr:hypothetical protein [Adiantum nelumboides]
MTSNFWKGLFENLGTRLNFSSAYHPQTDGQSEIANLMILDLLKSYVTEVDQRSQWEKYIPLVEYAYNNTVHTSIGKAPFEVIEGRPKSPLLLKVHGKIFAADEYSRYLKESFQKMKEAISISQQKQKAAANKHKRALAFKENDWVLLKFPKTRLRHTSGKNPRRHQKYYAKLAKRYYGPFQILKPINEMAYQLKLPNHWLIHNAFHVSLLKPYKGEPPSEAITEDPPEVEEVLQPESILRHEDKKKKDSKKEKDKAKKRKGKDKVDAEQDEIDRRIFAQLKTMGLTKLGMPERPYCTICQIFGHLDDRCWYNPNFRGRIPEHVKQKVQAPAVNEVGTGDNQPRPVNFRNWNNRGPNQRFRNQGGWMNQGNQNFQAADANAPCNYCGASGHRHGPDCSLWCKHRTERGIPIIRYTNKPEPSQQPPVQLNAVILEEMEVGTSKKWMNEAIPERSSDSKLQAEIPQEGQVYDIHHFQCDCTKCVNANNTEEKDKAPESMVVTRSGVKGETAKHSEKGKEKFPIDWGEQDQVRKGVMKEINRVHQKQGGPRSSSKRTRFRKLI